MRQNHHELRQLSAVSFHWYVHYVRHLLARSSCKTLDPFSGIPIEAFKTCIPDGSFGLQLAPQILSLVFGELFSSLVVTISRSRRVVSDLSAFGIMVFFACYGSVSFRFSSILRTIVGDATVYFIMAFGLQILVLLFIMFADVRCMSPLPIDIPLTQSPLECDQSAPSCVRTPLS
jgi:hypothetical protein